MSEPLYKQGDRVVFVEECSHPPEQCSYSHTSQVEHLRLIRGKSGRIDSSPKTSGNYVYYQVQFDDKGIGYAGSVAIYEHDLRPEVVPLKMTDEEIEQYYLENFIEA